MCGRYTLTQIVGELEEYARLVAPDQQLGPRYNIAPGQFAPVVVMEGAERAVKLMRWGLVPFWAKDEKIAFKTINARCETLGERASFKHALKKRRCLVLADGFYEWEKVPGGKQPHYIYLKDRRPFCFAGLWESWDKNEGPDPLETFTIVTTTPNSLLERVHNRMPVILDSQSEQTWLNLDAAGDELAGLYKPFDAGAMASHKVGPAVGSPRNVGKELIEPI